MDTTHSPRKVGRPFKCNDDHVPKFLEQIESGQSIAAAAAVAGFDQSTVMRWLESAREGKEEYQEFQERYARARGKAQSAMVAEIRRAGSQDWRATAWLCERMFQKDFSLKQTHEISGPDGSAIPMSIPVEVALSNDERFNLGQQAFEPSRS